MMLLIGLDNKLSIKPDEARYKNDKVIKVSTPIAIQLTDEFSDISPSGPVIETHYYRWVLSYRDWSIWVED